MADENKTPEEKEKELSSLREFHSAAGNSRDPSRIAGEAFNQAQRLKRLPDEKTLRREKQAHALKENREEILAPSARKLTASPHKPKPDAPKAP